MITKEIESIYNILIRENIDTIIRNFLRSKLTDHNSEGRAGEYIYEGWAEIRDLKIETHYPRISILEIGEPSKPFGLGSTSKYTSYKIQINVYVKHDQGFLIGDKFYEGDKLCKFITREILDAFDNHWVTDISQANIAIIYQQNNVSAPKNDYDKRLWTQRIDITLENIL